MSSPTMTVRGHTYMRDNFRCVTCGTTDGLQWQHRASSGMGGRGRKAAPLTTADGVTSCWQCNPRYESDLQPVALALGWKIRRNSPLTAAEIPFYNRTDRKWYLPGDGPDKTEIGYMLALELIHAAGGNVIMIEEPPASDKLRGMTELDKGDSMYTSLAGQS